MLKQAYEVVVHILNSATNHVRVLVGIATAEKQVIDQHAPDRKRSRSRAQSMSDLPSSPPPLEPALPGGRPGHRNITVASGDNLVTLALPTEYQFGYDWVQSECGEVLHVNANYCPDKKGRQRDGLQSTASKFWDRVRPHTTHGRPDHTPFKSTKQKLLQRECQLVIHLPTETFAFVDSKKPVRVEKMTTEKGRLKMHGKQAKDGKAKEYTVSLTADLSKFQPLVSLSQTAPPERKPAQTSVAYAVGKSLTKTLASKRTVAPSTDVRGIWKETRANPKFALFSWTRAIP